MAIGGLCRFVVVRYDNPADHRTFEKSIMDLRAYIRDIADFPKPGNSEKFGRSVLSVITALTIKYQKSYCQRSIPISLSGTDGAGIRMGALGSE